MLTKRLIYITTFILFSNIVFGQLGTKFVRVEDPSTITEIPEASPEQKAICKDVCISFDLGGFILPLYANKYEFAYNWNNNPIRLINAGAIIVDKHGRRYSVDNNGNLINHNGVIVDFSGIIIDDLYPIRKFFYWIESSPSYAIWWSIISIVLYSLIVIYVRKFLHKFKEIYLVKNENNQLLS